MFCLVFVFFFKQKTAYEMRISDWSSDVCSSDLIVGRVDQAHDPHAAIEQFVEGGMVAVAQGHPLGFTDLQRLDRVRTGQERISCQDRDASQGFPGRKSVVSGKSVSVRVDLGGCRIIQKKRCLIICANSK